MPKSREKGFESMSVKKHDPPLILVADDVLPTTVMLERIFEHEGYNVKSVYDGIAAVDAIQNLLPDLVLLDINMPGKNGFEVLSILRENPKTANIPTIIITAMGEHSDVVQGLNLGADDYLRKPFNPQELLARAQSKMRARKLEESLQERTRELEALLRVNEELSQHLEIDELLDFILYLVNDMLPTQIAAIYYLDDDDILSDYRIQRKDGNPTKPIPEGEAIVELIRTENRSIRWPDPDEQLVAGYASGIVTPLQYGNNVRGMLMVLSDEVYDANHVRFLQGISRPATLSIRNAELYEIQANYALHLQDMVEARTQELESAQQMLVRSEKLASVGRLAASIAHEINNPLLPIQINLEGMMEDIRAGIGIDLMDIERTLESVDRIKYIVDRLLDFTGNRQAGGANAQMINVNKVIEDIASLNRKMFQLEDLAIEVNTTEIPEIYGYRYQLEHVFMNMALNARDAMKPGGVVRFSTWVEDGQVVVSIEDNGSGIPEDLIDNIFEPFVSTKEDGNGLGLFISYGIVQKHNGSIHVESENNVGTRFTIRFPIAGIKSKAE